MGLLGKLYGHLYGDIGLFKEKGVGDMLAEKLVLDFEVVEEKSREKERIKIAKKTLADREPIEKIMNWTELSYDDIKKLQLK